MGVVRLWLGQKGRGYPPHWVLGQRGAPIAANLTLLWSPKDRSLLASARAKTSLFEVSEICPTVGAHLLFLRGESGDGGHAGETPGV